jgi:hypothetical protein
VLNSLLDSMTLDECRKRCSESRRPNLGMLGMLLTYDKRHHLDGLLSHDTTRILDAMSTK